MVYTTKQNGSKYAEDFKVYIYKGDKLVSPWHDIPLFDGNYVNCINEIPRFKNAKFEISKKSKFNPILQDSKKGKVRFVHNIFPLKGYPFNYGALPQTWENPGVKDLKCDAVGDNDPVDVIEIGTEGKKIGEVYKAKVLGGFALIDEGETDWKIIVIDADDVMAEKLNGVEDIEKYMPGLVEKAFFWFRNYKLADNKPVNKFGLDEKCINANEAIEILNESHYHWKKLMTEGYPMISLSNSTLEGTLEYENPEDIKCEEKDDVECPEYIKGYFYVN